MLLVEKGKAKLPIIISPEASTVERFAAEELQSYLRKISGARLRIATGGEAKEAVFVGRAEWWRKGRVGKRMAPESLRIVTDNGSLYLLGADDRGTLYSVYTFIEKHLGVRWPSYRSEDEVIPRKQTIRLPRIDRYEQPFFSHRRMICGLGAPSGPVRDALSWMVKNKANIVYDACSGPEHQDECAGFLVEEAVRKRGMTVVWSQHSFSVWGPQKDVFPQHPEYFALVNGTRNPVTICTSHPKVAEIMANNIIAFSQKFPDIQTIGFWPNDQFFWCECDECQKAEPFWTSPVNPAPLVGDTTRMHTRKYLAFANKVIGLVTKKCPKLRFEIIAYWTTLEPPENLGFPIHPNLNLAVAPIERHYDRPLNKPLTKAELRDTFIEGIHLPWDRNKYVHYPRMLAEWRKIFPGPMYIYEYYTASHGDLGCLFPVTRVIRADSLFYKQLGIDGFGTQGWIGNWPSYGLNYWFSLRCGWDGTSSHDELLTQYCREFYGPAAEPMKKFFLELENSFSSKRVGLWLRQMVRVFTPAVVSACTKDLQEAKAKARDKKVRRRIYQMEVLLKYGDLLYRVTEIGRAAHQALLAAVAVPASPKDAGKSHEEFYRLLHEQMALQLEIMDLLKIEEVFEPGYGASMPYYFYGVGAFWLQNDWGLYHSLKLLQPLTEQV